MKRFRNFFNKSILATILLLVILTAHMTVLSEILRDNVEKEAFQTLQENINLMTDDIRRIVGTDQAQMALIRDTIEAQKRIDLVVAKNTLKSFSGRGMITEFYMLFPDNRLLAQTGKWVSNTTGLDFAKEKEKERYISTVKENFADVQEKIVYHMQPVQKNGAVTGILYGVVKLKRLSELYHVTCFEGEAEMYLIEGLRGDFLMDTWHKSLGNISELKNRTPGKGYSAEKVRQQIINGESGLSVFTSETSGEKLYFCYQPAGINDWMVAMTVPESSVFAASRAIRQKLWFFAAVDAAAVILYFLWILQNKRKEDREKELQLHQANYMYEIQKILFESHRKQRRMQEALAKVGEKLSAETAFFIVIDGERAVIRYLWNAQGKEIPEYPYDFSNTEKTLEQGESYLLYDIRKLRETQPESYRRLKEMGVKNMMLTRVCGSDENIRGVLGVCNTKNQWQDARYLECVVLSFFLAYKNIRSQEVIGEMASIDAMTGLLNRNSHEMAIRRYESGGEVPDACVYVDVNGLHELNNTLGHEAGDEMLRFIGESMQRVFGRNDVYRIGGDEMLAFVFDIPEAEIERKLQELTETVESRDYHISAGMEYRKGKQSVNHMVEAAEKKMYREKKEYYKNHKNAEKERGMNWKLELLLQEKKDADTFLSFLAPRFAGVYIVNLAKNISREIYLPEDFRYLLSKHDNNFWDAFDEYITEFIREEEQQQAAEQLKPEHLVHILDENTNMELSYKKKNGEKIRLSIYKSGSYSEREKETIWVFEKE